MATYGPNSPSTFATDSSNGGTTSWTNTSNASTADGSYATSAMAAAAATYYLKATNFGFAVAGTIEGVKVEYKGFDPNAEVLSWEIKLVVGGTIVGDNKGLFASVPTSNAYLDFGGATDLWGTTLSSGDVNASDFGCVLSFTNNDDHDPQTISIDHIRVTVYATGDATISPTGISSTAAFGTTTLSPGEVVISPSSRTSTLVFGTPTTTSSATIAPSGIGSTTTFGTSTTSPGTATISPSSRTSTLVFGTVVVASVVHSINPVAIASTTALGSPTIAPTGSTYIRPDAIASTAVGFPELTPGEVTIAPAGFTSTTFGSPFVGSVIHPLFWTRTTTFGSPTVVPGLVTIAPTAIEPTAEFGGLAVGDLIYPEGIGSTTSLGTLVVSNLNSILPTSIQSTLSFGSTLVSTPGNDCPCNTFLIAVGGGVLVGGTADEEDTATSGGCTVGGNAFVDLVQDVWDGFEGVWLLHEPALNTTAGFKDRSKHLYHGTGGGGYLPYAPTQDEGTFCRYSQHFGGHQFIALPADAIRIDQAFTVSGWVRLETFYEDRTWFSRGGCFSLGYNFLNAVQAQLQVLVDGEETTLYCTGGTTLEQERFYHVACVWRPGLGLYVYLDGVLDNSTATTATTTTGTVVAGSLGRTTTGGNRMKGNLQDFRVTGESRSAAWLRAEYDNYCSPLFVLVSGEV